MTNLKIILPEEYKLMSSPEIIICPLPGNDGTPELDTSSLYGENLIIIPGDGLMIKIGENHTISVNKRVHQIQLLMSVVKNRIIRVQVNLIYEDGTVDSSSISTE